MRRSKVSFRFRCIGWLQTLVVTTFVLFATGVVASPLVSAAPAEADAVAAQPVFFEPGPASPESWSTTVAKPDLPAVPRDPPAARHIYDDAKYDDAKVPGSAIHASVTADTHGSHLLIRAVTGATFLICLAGCVLWWLFVSERGRGNVTRRVRRLWKYGARLMLGRRAEPDADDRLFDGLDDVNGQARCAGATETDASPSWFEDYRIVSGARAVEKAYAGSRQAINELSAASALRETLEYELTGVKKRLRVAFAISVGGGDQSDGVMQRQASVLRNAKRDIQRIEKIAISALADPQGAAVLPPMSLQGSGEDGQQGVQLIMPRSLSEAYAVLGVTDGVSENALKKVVDGLRLSWHPDLAAHDVDRVLREDRIKQINLAWDLIKKHARKQKSDASDLPSGLKPEAAQRAECDLQSTAA